MQKYLFVLLISFFIAFASAAQPLKSFGFIFNSNNKDSVMVTAVIEKGPANLAGIKQGDLLISINGKNLKGATLQQVAALIAPADEISLEFSQNGDTKKTQLKKAAAYTFDRECIEGNCINGKGKALLKWQPDLQFEGTFKDGVLSGEGKMFSSKGDLLYEGEIKNMAANGRGKMYSYYLADGQPKRFLAQDGMFEDNQLTEGKTFIADRERASGSWTNGRLIKGYFYRQYAGSSAYMFCDKISYDERGQMKLDGPVTVRKGTPDGEILSKGVYKNNKRTGAFEESDWKGEYTHYVVFNDGKLLDSSGKVKRRSDERMIGRKITYLKNGTVDNLVWNLETGYFSFLEGKELFVGEKGKRSLVSSMKDEYDSKSYVFKKGPGIFLPQKQAYVPTYVIPENDIVADKRGPVRQFKIYDYDKEQLASFIPFQDKTSDAFTSKWDPKEKRFNYTQTAKGFQFIESGASVSPTKIWHYDAEFRLLDGDENSFNGIYMKGQLPGETYEKYILVVSSRVTHSFWFGEYDPVKKTFLSYTKGGNAENVIAHDDLQKWSHSRFHIHRNGDVLLLDLCGYIRFNYEITSDMKLFDNIKSAGLVTINPQKGYFNKAEFENLSSITGMKLKDYYDKLRKEENERLGAYKPVTNYPSNTNSGSSNSGKVASAAEQKALIEYDRVHGEIENMITRLSPDANKWYGLPAGHRLFNMRLGNSVESRKNEILSRIRNFMSSSHFSKLPYSDQAHFKNDLRSMEAMHWDYVDYVAGDDDDDW